MFIIHWPQTGLLPLPHSVDVLLRLHTAFTRQLTLLPSWVVAEDDKVDAGAGVLPDDVDVFLCSADNWRKNCRRDICAFVVFRNRIHALMSANVQYVLEDSKRPSSTTCLCRHLLTHGIRHVHSALVFVVIKDWFWLFSNSFDMQHLCAVLTRLQQFLLAWLGTWRGSVNHSCRILSRV